MPGQVCSRVGRVTAPECVLHTEAGPGCEPEREPRFGLGPERLDGDAGAATERLYPLLLEATLEAGLVLLRLSTEWEGGPDWTCKGELNRGDRGPCWDRDKDLEGAY
jgi:hypothetical protein